MIRSCFYTYPYHLRCSCLKIKALCHLYLKMAKDSSFVSIKLRKECNLLEMSVG